METKLTTFKLPVELHKKLKEIAAREGTDMTTILLKELEEYVKIHGDGNPVYSLEKWIADSQFKSYPALMDPSRNWLDYLSKCTKEEAEEIYHKCTGIRESARNYF